MFHLSDVMTLAPGEQIRLLARAKRSTLIIRLAMCGVLTVVASAVLFSFPFGSPAFFMSVGVLVVCAITAAQLLIRWDGTVLVVTDRRCVLAVRGGFIKRSLVELPLAQVQAVEVGKRGLTFRAHGLQREALFPPVAKAQQVVSLVSPGGRSS